jgi:hypothetical protein
MRILHLLSGVLPPAPLLLPPLLCRSREKSRVTLTWCRIQRKFAERGVRGATVPAAAWRVCKKCFYMQPPHVSCERQHLNKVPLKSLFENESGINYRTVTRKLLELQRRSIAMLSAGVNVSGCSWQ